MPARLRPSWAGSRARGGAGCRDREAEAELQADGGEAEVLDAIGDVRALGQSVTLSAAAMTSGTSRLRR